MARGPWSISEPRGARCLSAVCSLQVRAGIPHAVAVTSQASVNPAQHLLCPRLLCAQDSGPLSFRRSPPLDSAGTADLGPSACGSSCRVTGGPTPGGSGVFAQGFRQVWLVLLSAPCGIAGDTGGIYTSLRADGGVRNGLTHMPACDQQEWTLGLHGLPSRVLTCFPGGSGLQRPGRKLPAPGGRGQRPSASPVGVVTILSLTGSWLQPPATSRSEGGMGLWVGWMCSCPHRSPPAG